MQGQLFTQDFLRDGIKTTPVWQNLPDAALDAFISELANIYSPFGAASNLNEAGTEQEIILRVLVALGWSELLLPQNKASGTRREDVPDWLLFADASAKIAALRERKEDRRYRHGIAILEAKRWMRPLDRGDATDTLDPGTPSNQILRYMSAAEVASERNIRWGILSNGRHWRLYYQEARSRSEEFLELDVGTLIGVPGLARELTDEFDSRHGLKLFFCFFHRAAFLPQLFFHLYGISRADAAYILDTFPIMREQDEASFGFYLTKELVLGYMNALGAEDTETVLAI